MELRGIAILPPIDVILTILPFLCSLITGITACMTLTEPKKLVSSCSSNLVHIKKDSCVQFLITGSPKLLPPSSLAVTAYYDINGTAAEVLDASDNDNTALE
jgi:hypothetical protein